MASIKFSTSATPIEVATVQEGTGPSIAATECYGSVGGNGEVESIAVVSGGGSNDGYTDGAKFYLSATAVVDGSAVAITNLASTKFIYFKHTGYQYSSSSALSSTANTADVLTITAGSTVIARLKAGEAIMLPTRGATALNQFKINSGDGTNLDATAGSATIAVEFLAFA